jgi:hypothetical protein
MKLKEIESVIPKDKVPQVPLDQVCILWANDFWDGYLTGICEHAGQKLYFKMIEETENEDISTWYRRFVLIRLDGKQLDQELYWHEQFLKYVGSHFDYGSDRKRDHTGMKPQSEWSKFYDPYNEYKPDFSENEVAGWFEK